MTVLNRRLMQCVVSVVVDCHGHGRGCSLSSWPRVRDPSPHHSTWRTRVQAVRCQPFVTSRPEQLSKGCNGGHWKLTGWVTQALREKRSLGSERVGGRTALDVIICSLLERGGSALGGAPSTMETGAGVSVSPRGTCTSKPTSFCLLQLLSLPACCPLLSPVCTRVCTHRCHFLHF